MNGPDHYRKAEQLLRQSQLDDHGENDKVSIAAAQVHATLAVAAATTLRTAHEFYEIADDIEAWAQVTDAAVLRDDIGPLDPNTADERPIIDVHLPDQAADRV